MCPLLLPSRPGRNTEAPTDNQRNRSGWILAWTLGWTLVRCATRAMLRETLGTRETTGIPDTVRTTPRTPGMLTLARQPQQPRCHVASAMPSPSHHKVPMVLRLHSTTRTAADRRKPQPLMENPDYPAKGMACQPPRHQATLGKGLRKAPGIHAAGCSDDHPDHNGTLDCLDLIARSGLPLPLLASDLLCQSLPLRLHCARPGLIADPSVRE